MDSDLYANNDKEVRSYKDLMESACQRIKSRYTQDEIKSANLDRVKSILGMIDSIFTENKFLYFTAKDDSHFDFLTLAMRDWYPSDRYGYYTGNDYRDKFWSSHKGEQCRLIDCDLYSEVYIGVAQMAGLPLTMVEIPHHNYVRWHYPDGRCVRVCLNFC